MSFKRISTAIVFLGLAACTGASGDRHSALKREIARGVVDSVARHLALLFEGEILRDAPIMEVVMKSTLTIDLQEELLDHGKPVIVKGNLTDIRKLSQGSYQVSFGPRMMERPIHYLLVASQEQVDRIRALQRPYMLPTNGFVVALSPTSIDRLPLSVERSSMEEESLSGLGLHRDEGFLVAGTLLGYEYFEDMPLGTSKHGVFAVDSECSLFPC